MDEVMEVINTANVSKLDSRTDSMKALELINECSLSENLEQWNGTLREYFQQVIDNPHLCDNAHAYIWRMIESAGIEYAESDEKKEHPQYKFFWDLYGIDDTLEQVMEYFKAAASGSDVSKRILMLFGPTSSGKSDFTTHIKDGLETFSRTDDGRIYAISGCPMHENPINAIPKVARKRLLNEHGLFVEGKLCPVCAMRVKDEFNGDFWSLPVERIFLCEDDRVGIGTFQPSDTKSQDQSELTGSINFAKVAEYGSESDPRSFDFTGELNVANRGVMEFIELLKVDPKFRYVLLTLAEEKKIKAPRFALISADLAVISHTNEREYLKFVSEKAEEAIQDRMWVRKFPYNMKVSDEVKIYEKLITQKRSFRDVHVAPHTLKVAAMFAVLTRLEEPDDGEVSLLRKMRAYNGEDVELTESDIQELKDEAEREGMDGISPRYIVNRLSAAFVKHGTKYVTPISALRSIQEGFETNAKLSLDDIDKFQDFISDVIEEYNKIARNEVQKAFFVNFEGEIKALLNNYIDNALAFLEDNRIKNEWGEFEEPNEALMRKVEEKIGVTDEGKRSFREEVTRKMLQIKATKGEYDYKAHARLNEALKEQLFDERSPVIRMTVETRNPDPDALRRLNEVIDTLVKKFEYTVESANELLRYVNNIMSKSS
jgi:serine protein kinase